MALLYANIQIEIREISLRDRPTELYAASSKGTVPVLVTLDNFVIDESLDIMLWSLDNFSNQKWLGVSRNRVLDIIHHNDTEFKKWLDRYKYYDRYPQNSREFYREKCAHTLSFYEQYLEQNQYLLSKDVSLADIAIFPFIRQFANIDNQWFSNNYNRLTFWFEQISSSDLFINVMEKYPLWNKKDRVIINSLI